MMADLCNWRLPTRSTSSFLPFNRLIIIDIQPKPLHLHLPSLNASRSQTTAEEVAKMVNMASFLLFSFTLFVLSSANSIDPQPEIRRSFKINRTQTASGCSYTVSIKTSCSSTSYTRDAISLAFGDAYGNQVYAPRLDDPSSRTFERCSTDTFKISGPCLYQICYLYLLRQGSDGWKPESVKIYPPSSTAITYKYNIFLPNGVWYGFDHCNAGGSISEM